MDPVSKALWLIETELDESLDLERLASVCGLSRFSLFHEHHKQCRDKAGGKCLKRGNRSE